MGPPDFPRDADGDALRRVAEHADLSRPMRLDFMVALPTEQAARAVARAAAALGYATATSVDAGSGTWTCTCSRSMLATYDGVVSAQRELAALSAPHGGAPDGWGTFGNLAGPPETK